jgi:aminoglycoside 6'-N-acetyltransferase
MQHKRGPVVSLRPLSATDLVRLSEWLEQPHVETWWFESSALRAVAESYLPSITGGEAAENFVIMADDQPVGLIQRYFLRDYPEWEETLWRTGMATDRVVGIDGLVGDPAIARQGVGSEAIRELAQSTFELPDVDGIVAVPQQANVGAWRALEKVGFTRTWSGLLQTEEPADQGPAYIYELRKKA